MRFVQDAIHGFRLPFQGLAFLLQHRSLWKWAALPAAVNVLLFSIAFAIFVTYVPAIFSGVTGALQVESSSTQYAWLWVEPLRILTWLLGGLLIAISGAALALAFLFLGTIIASPFLDLLAQQVEYLQGVPQTTTLRLRDVWHSFWTAIGAELKRLSFVVAVYLILFVLGIIPVIAPLTLLAGTLFTMLFLPLQYAGYTMDHRLMTFRQRRELVAQRPWLMLGFGAASFLTLMVPLLNFICLPFLVVGGTLMMMEFDWDQPPAIGGMK